MSVLRKKKEAPKLEFVEISTMHGTYKTTINEMQRRRKPWVPNNPKHILSFIPGTILTIDVEVGQKVKVGDQLITFKAMKMRNVLCAEIDGIIKAINVGPGDPIPKGTIMLEFE